MTSTATPGVSRINYDGRVFRPVGHHGAEVTEESPGNPPSTARGRYHQEGDLVWVEFSGPTIPVGRLVGHCRPDGVLDAAYCMVGTAGDPMAGVCESTPTVLPDGRLFLTERWHRIDGSSGVSYIEEIVE